jgi:hypothetical protein
MEMRRVILLLSLAVAPLCAFGSTYSELKATGEPFAVPFKASQQEMEAAIIESAARTGWVPVRLDDKTVQATLHVRDHVAVVHIVYSSDSFRVNYFDSTNLMPPARIETPGQTSSTNPNNMFRESEPARIHKNYYVWTEDLARNIIQSLATMKKSALSAKPLASNDSVSNRLRELDNLRKDGVITDQEYKAMRAKALGL